jgi:hypothetical protein
MESSQNELVQTFQDGVSSLLMATEELRQRVVVVSHTTPSTKQQQPLRSEACLAIRHDMEEIMAQLFQLHPQNDLEGDLRQHCHQKAANVAFQVLTKVITKEEEDPDQVIEPELEKDAQGSIARIAELNLVLHSESKERIQDIIDTYVSYQRKVLRLRSKPSIARLVERRQRPTVIGEEQQEEDNDAEESTKSQHSHVITTILGQASSLIHPLIIWKCNLPDDDLENLHKLCQQAIQILDEQAQSLTKTVATWCLEDLSIDEWMAKSANETLCKNNEIAEVDSVVEELAFSCQVLDRYMGVVVEGHTQETTIKELLPELTWKYASLERYLTTQQVVSALTLAKPVQIVLGTSIHVPSVVEDAQYLSSRALERAASTRSTHAIGTVAHSIANDVWSTELSGGVYQALVDQKGCWEEPATTEPSENLESKPNTSNSFAQALLGALDDDLSSTTNTAKPALPPPAPSSGGFLGSALSSLSSGDKLSKIRLDTYICALNGLHSASTACSSLVEYLDSLLPTEEIQQDGNAATMIHLAREELVLHSGNYHRFLQNQVSRVVREFCGSVEDAAVYKGGLCIPYLRYYLERENYELPNTDALQQAEDDVRLRKVLIEPMEESHLLQEFEKCDLEVIKGICQELVSSLVDLFLNCIHSEEVPKRFTVWGSLLLSKQVRTMQNYITGLMEKASEDEAIPVLPQWEGLDTVVTILQLEKPSDWSFYRESSILPVEEVERNLLLRVDFSKEIVAAVLANKTNK